MKKILFLLSMMVALQVSAQNFKFIPKVGMNLANVTKSEADMKIGMNVGVAGEWMLSESFGIEPGVFFGMQGAKEGDYKLNLNYINIPINAKYYVTKGLFAFAGPQIGFNVGAKAKFGDESESIKDQMKTVDFGIGVGVGYQFDMGLMASAGYNFGLTNVAKEGDGKNSVFQINVGWRF